MLFTADFGFFVCLFVCLFIYLFFFAAFWLGIFVEMDVDIITTPSPPFRPAPMFLLLPTILSLIQVTVIRNQSHQCAPKAGFGTA